MMHWSRFVHQSISEYETAVGGPNPFKEDLSFVLVWLAVHHPHHFDASARERLEDLHECYAAPDALPWQHFRLFGCECALYALKDDWDYAPCLKTQRLFQPTNRNALLSEMGRHARDVVHKEGVYALEYFYLLSPALYDSEPIMTAVWHSLWNQGHSPNPLHLPYCLRILQAMPGDTGIRRAEVRNQIWSTERFGVVYTEETAELLHHFLRGWWKDDSFADFMASVQKFLLGKIFKFGNDED